MIEEIRSGILSVEGVAEDVIDEEYGEEKTENEVHCNRLSTVHNGRVEYISLDSILLKIMMETVNCCIYTYSTLEMDSTYILEKQL